MAKHWIKGVILGLLIAVGGWAVFNLVIELIKKPFSLFGVTDPIYLYIFIIVFVIVAMIIGWRTGLAGAIKRLVK